MSGATRRTLRLGWDWLDVCGCLSGRFFCAIYHVFNPSYSRLAATSSDTGCVCERAVEGSVCGTDCWSQ